MITTPRLALALTLAALLSPLARAGEVAYRVSGQDPAFGPCTGLVLVDDAAGALTVRHELHYASGEDELGAGPGVRSGSTITTTLASTGGLAPTPPRSLTLQLGAGGTIAVSEAGGAGLQLGGRRLDLARQADLLPGDPNGRGARLLASVAAARGGTIGGKGGVPLRWVAFEATPELAALVVLPGRTEPAERYAELAADLVPLGYSLFVLDERGQGRSGRLLGRSDPPGSPERQKGYVERFEDYVEDLHTFLHQVVRATPHRHVFGLGHSMGGAILARHAELHPGELEALVLCAPMLRIPVSYWEARYVDLQVLIGRGKSYARGEGPVDPTKARFAGNHTTHSEPRFRWKNEDILVPSPELWVGGPTYRWVHEALRGTSAVRKDARRLRAPTLLLQASADTVVVNSGQDEVAAAARGVVEKVVIAGARHELLLEADALRRAALLRIVAFVDRHAGVGRP